MKVQNNENYPMQLDDERIIGAAGTPESVREYDLDKLGANDKRREKAGSLQIVEEKPAVVEPAKEAATAPTKDATISTKEKK